jgi:hypothetical protein
LASAVASGGWRTAPATRARVAATVGITFETLGARIALGVVVLLAYRLVTAPRGLRAPFAPTLVVALVVALVIGVASAVGSAIGTHSEWRPCYGVRLRGTRGEEVPGRPEEGACLRVRTPSVSGSTSTSRRA